MHGGLEQNTKRLLLFELLTSFHMMGGVLIPFYLEWGRLGMSQVLLLQSVFMLALFLFEVPTGAFADKFGRKKSLALSGAVTGLSVLAYTAVPDFGLFALAEVLFALGAALANGADDAMLVDSLKALGREGELQKRLGRMRTFALAGMAVSAPIGSVVAQFTDVRLPFLLTAVPLILSSLVALSMAEPPGSNHKKKSMRLLREGLLHFRQSRELRLLTLEMASVGTVGYFVIWLYQAALLQAGVAVGYLGFVQAALVGTEAAVLALMPKLTARLGTSRTAFLFPALTGAGFMAAGLLLTGHGLAMLLAGSLLLAGGFGLTQEAFLQPMMQKLIPSEKRATISSVTASTKELGKGLANPLVGLAADASLGMTFLGLGAAAMAVAALSPARRVLKKQQRQSV